ncbi:Hsp20/alpha crystallin family protein [Geobacter sp. SVR]|uniref:Hsp20/alpha crystallin family protein n=1 Tax=Geobacter sp. SVR TaxID=2495594 RepID=UPI00143F02EB|nr:Hsp20/alpha crystallin family protein [Geobacter sp. SVR]BCS51887.1 molecular chaperone [Geobacter sp. SVR]GCF87729.1 molecular chaperone [Geobacter sp. SVR]
MRSWDLLREMDNLRREINQAFQGYGFNRPLGTTFLSQEASRCFPLVNLSEDKDHVYVNALVPGVDPKQIDLSVLRDTITISGERKPFDEQKGQTVHRCELGSGTFSRTVELPADIDPNKIEAECIDGILSICLAKAEHAKPKKIGIKLS